MLNTKSIKLNNSKTLCRSFMTSILLFVMITIVPCYCHSFNIPTLSNSADYKWEQRQSKDNKTNINGRNIYYKNKLRPTQVIK